jgi:hypothetical protein
MAERLFGPENKHTFLHFFSPRETAQRIGAWRFSLVSIMSAYLESVMHINHTSFIDSDNDEAVNFHSMKYDKRDGISYGLNHLNGGSLR